MKTKWKPIYVYNYDGVDLIIFAKLKKTGLLTFRTKRITSRFRCSYVFCRDVFDIEEELKKIFKTNIF